MKVIVCGSRNWTNREKIADRLIFLQAVNRGVRVVLIEGEARGADRLAREVGEELGFPVVPIPAEWDRHGKRAGIIRNAWMLLMEPDLVIAFHENLEESKGTGHMVRIARKVGVPVEVVT